MDFYIISYFMQESYEKKIFSFWVPQKNNSTEHHKHE